MEKIIIEHGRKPFALGLDVGVCSLQEPWLGGHISLGDKVLFIQFKVGPVQEHDSMKLVTKERKIFQCFKASLKKSLEKVQNKAKELGEMLA